MHGSDSGTVIPQDAEEMGVGIVRDEQEEYDDLVVDLKGVAV